jgi:hypothetical protein
MVLLRPAIRPQAQGAGVERYNARIVGSADPLKPFVTTARIKGAPTAGPVVRIRLAFAALGLARPAFETSSRPLPDPMKSCDGNALESLAQTP